MSLSAEEMDGMSDDDWDEYGAEKMGLDDEDDDLDFADPGGRSALRAATEDNPRVHPCPDCGAQDVLTPKDVALGYCCNACADRNEGGGY